MDKRFLFSALMMVSVLVSSFSQLLLKKAALRQYSGWLKSYLNPLVISAYGIFFLTTIFNVYALRYVPLSFAAVLEASAYIYVPIMGHCFLKERLNGKKTAGIFIILFGILVFAL